MKSKWRRGVAILLTAVMMAGLSPAALGEEGSEMPRETQMATESQTSTVNLAADDEAASTDTNDASSGDDAEAAGNGEDKNDDTTTDGAGETDPNASGNESSSGESGTGGEIDSEDSDNGASSDGSGTGDQSADSGGTSSSDESGSGHGSEQKSANETGTPSESKSSSEDQQEHLFTLTVDAQREGSSDQHLSGMTFQILDAEGSVVVESTVKTAQEQTLTVTLTAQQYQALSDASGHTQTWSIAVKDVPENLTLVTPEDGKRSFTLKLNESGEPVAELDGSSAVVFTFTVANALTVKVQDTAGKGLKDAQISLVADNGTVVAQKTIDSADTGAVFAFGGTDSDLTVEALKTKLALETIEQLNGVELEIVQTEAPEDYRQKASTATDKVRLSMTSGVLTVAPKEMILTDVRTTIAVKITSTVANTRTKVSGAVYQIKYGAADTTLTNAHVVSGSVESEEAQDTDPAQFSSSEEDVSAQLRVPDEVLQQLDALGEGQQAIGWKVVYQSSPGYTLSSAAEVTYWVGFDADGNTVTADTQEAVIHHTATSDSPATASFTYQQVATGVGKIRVTLKNYYNGKSVYPTEEKTFYVALFDAEGNRISEPKKLTMAARTTSVSATFSKLDAGTYYVYEVRPTNFNKTVPTSADSQGKFDYYATYASSSSAVKNGNVVTLKKKTTATQQINISNHYSQMPDNSAMSASFYVIKQWNNSADTTVTKPSTFYFKVEVKNESTGVYSAVTQKDASGQTQDRVFSLTFEGTSTTATKKLSFSVSDTAPSRQIRIVEVNADGSQLQTDTENSELNVINDVTYKVSYTNQEITISADQTSDPQVVIRNTVVKEEEETESEDDDDDLVAQLTLTKRVTYKNSAIRVNAVYYIGIFNDAALTDLRYTRALQFRNASEVSATLKINLYRLSSKEVTFYFAEVDKNGNVVRDGSSVGYEISQNKTSITLNRNNVKDEVVVTNNIKTGSQTESALTNASSGFAGDSAALAQAQALEADENAGIRSTTGDSTPILPLVAVAVGTLVVILLVVILLRRRRKKG